MKKIIGKVGLILLAMMLVACGGEVDTDALVEKAADAAKDGLSSAQGAIEEGVDAAQDALDDVTLDDLLGRLENELGDLNLVHGDLMEVISAVEGSGLFVGDDQLIDIVIHLDGEEHVDKHDEFTMEFTMGGTDESQDIYIVNGIQVDADEAQLHLNVHLDDLQSNLEKKLSLREGELEAFLNQVGLELPDEDAIDHLSGTVRLSLTKQQILDLALNHRDLLANIDIFQEHVFGQASYPASDSDANMNSTLDDLGIGSWWRDRPEVGIYMRDTGCYTSSTELPDSRFKNPNSVAPENDHTYRVAWTMGQTATNADILCGSDWHRAPSTLPEGFPKIQVANHSWGAPSNRYNSESKATDEAVLDTGIATFVAAGNDGAGMISDKAAGYNVITVGAWDASTGAMASFSSSNTVPNTGVSKPDIAAPGVGIASPWGTWQGTSVASPIAAGIGANLAGWMPGAGYAPTMKALIMLLSPKAATGMNHAGPNNSVVMDRDGVGVIDMWAFTGQKISCTSYARDSIDATDVWTTTVDGKPARQMDINLKQGQKYRLAYVYLVDPNYVMEEINAGRNGRPNMNVDMRIFAPGATSPVASSLSTTNNWEMVEFTADQTGVYTLELRQESTTMRGKMAMSWCITPGDV